MRGAAPFEIRDLLSFGEAPDTPPGTPNNTNGRRSPSPNRQSKFPRTQWLKFLLLSVCGLAILVFLLNLMESSQIPLMSSMGSDERKWQGDDMGNGGYSSEEPPPPGGSPSSSFDATPPTISPALRATQTPASVSNNSVSNNTDVMGEQSPTGEELLTPGEPNSPPLSNNIDSAPASPPDPYQSVDNIPNVVQNFNYSEGSQHILPDASSNFVDRWCDLNGLDWFPKGDKSWELRAPAVLMPGARSSGISSLASLLNQHPQVIPPANSPATEQFFSEEPFRKYVRKNQKTTVMQARARLVALNYNKLHFQKDPQSISYYSSPGYLFRSNVLPRRLFCVLPWIKMVVLLREPVERVYQHYLSSKELHLLPHSLEDWIEQDLDLMRDSGLIANKTSATAGKLNMTDEDVAWYRYQHRSFQGPVGRSLYEIQLRQWFQGLQAIGRDPKDSVLIVRTEELAENPEREYKRILAFLNLNDFKPPSFEAVSALASEKSGEMNEATRTRLETFFKPYNMRLQKLLRSYKIPYGSGGKKAGEA